MVDIGVFTEEEFTAGNLTPGYNRLPDSIFGAVRMLQEMHAQFDIISSDRDLSQYRLLILPDGIPVDDALAARLEAYLDAGGALIASHMSGLRPDGQGFASPRFGVEYIGPAPYSPDFLVPGETLRAGSGLNPTGYAMYERGTEVAAASESDVLAEVEVPYFNRTWRHFCSHRHTPSAQRIGYPGIVRRGRVIYFSHPIFTMYQANAPLWCRKLLAAAVDLLLPQPALTIQAPSSVIAALARQPEAGRQVLHLLHYIPERRGAAFDVVEDVIPLYNLPISLRVEGPVERVACVPQGACVPQEALSFTQEDGRVRFTVPCLTGYQVIEVVS